MREKTIEQYKAVRVEAGKRLVALQEWFDGIGLCVECWGDEFRVPGCDPGFRLGYARHGDKFRLVVKLGDGYEEMVESVSQVVKVYAAMECDNLRLVFENLIDVVVKDWEEQ